MLSICNQYKLSKFSVYDQYDENFEKFIDNIKNIINDKKKIDDFKIKYEQYKKEYTGDADGWETVKKKSENTVNTDLPLLSKNKLVGDVNDEYEGGFFEEKRKNDIEIKNSDEKTILEKY